MRAPRIKGDKILFSNHLNKSVDDCLEEEEQYEEGQRQRQEEEEAVEWEGEAEGEGKEENEEGLKAIINRDIFCFSMHKPTGILAANDKPKSPTRDMFIPSIPYVSPSKRDVFAFFSSEEIRSSFIEDEEGDVCEKCEEEIQKKEEEEEVEGVLKDSKGKDIFVFSRHDKTSQTEDTSTTAEKSLQNEGGERKKFIFANNKGYISFFSSEDSYLEEVCRFNELLNDDGVQDEVMDCEERDEEGEGEEVHKPDIHVFSNKPKSEQDKLIPISKQYLTTEGEDGPRALFTNKHGIFAFYSNEASFNEATEDVTSEEEIGTEEDQDDEHILENGDEAGEVNQKDIHTFSNDPDRPRATLSEAVPVEEDTSDVRRVVDGDTISFYNPSPQKSGPCLASGSISGLASKLFADAGPSTPHNFSRPSTSTQEAASTKSIGVLAASLYREAASSSAPASTSIGGLVNTLCNEAKIASISPTPAKSSADELEKSTKENRQEEIDAIFRETKSTYREAASSSTPASKSIGGLATTLFNEAKIASISPTPAKSSADELEKSTKAKRQEEIDAIFRESKSTYREAASSSAPASKSISGLATTLFNEAKIASISPTPAKSSADELEKSTKAKKQEEIDSIFRESKSSCYSPKSPASQRKQPLGRSDDPATPANSPCKVTVTAGHVGSLGGLAANLYRESASTSAPAQSSIGGLATKLFNDTAIASIAPTPSQVKKSQSLPYNKEPTIYIAKKFIAPTPSKVKKSQSLPLTEPTPPVAHKSLGSFATELFANPRATSTPLKSFTPTSPHYPPPPEQEDDMPPPPVLTRPLSVTGQAAVLHDTDDMIDCLEECVKEFNLDRDPKDYIRMVEDGDGSDIEDIEDMEDLELEEELEEALLSSCASLEMQDGELAIEDIDNLNDIELAIDMVSLNLSVEDEENNGMEYPQDQGDVEFEVEIELSLEEELRREDEKRRQREEIDDIMKSSGFLKFEEEVRGSLQTSADERESAKAKRRAEIDTILKESGFDLKEAVNAEAKREPEKETTQEEIDAILKAVVRKVDEDNCAEDNSDVEKREKMRAEIENIFKASGFGGLDNQLTQGAKQKEKQKAEIDDFFSASGFVSLEDQIRDSLNKHRNSEEEQKRREANKLRKQWEKDNRNIMKEAEEDEVVEEKQQEGGSNYTSYNLF